MTTTSDKIVLHDNMRLIEPTTGIEWELRIPKLDQLHRVVLVDVKNIGSHDEANSKIIPTSALLAEIAAGTYTIAVGVHPITSAIEAAKRMRHNLDNIINDLETIAILGHHATKNSFYVSDNAKLVAFNLNTRICDWHDEVDEDNLVIAEYIGFTSKL